MKITIYELLGLVKEDKAPKEILYNNRVWKYKEQHKDYYNDMWSLLENQIDVITCYFNDIVEIIEDKEYEDIEGINYYPKNKTEFQVDYYEDGELKHFCLNKKQRYFADKINALIRNQKYILERLNKEGNNE
jgi:hypothetical protein